MEALKKLIGSVDKQTQEIKDKINLVNKATEAGGYKVLTKNGYHQVYFKGERAEKIRALIESFIIEDENIRDPQADKLNTISKLLGSD